MTDIETKISGLAARFAARAVEERRALTASLAAGDRATIAERSHKLAGIAGMLGYSRIGEAALALERAAEEGHPMNAEARRLIARLASLENS